VESLLKQICIIASNKAETKLAHHNQSSFVFYTNLKKDDPQQYSAAKHAIH